MINCQGVAVDLRTGERREARPGDLFMKCAGFKPLDASFEEALEAAPVFRQFVKDITCQKRDAAEYLMHFLGYSLTGNMKEQCYLNFWGAKGANGKSTLLNLARRIWGDYAIEAPDSVVLKKRDNSGRFDIANIVGARLVIKADIPEGAWLNSENIKNLTGGDESFYAEKKYHDGFFFKPLCKVILSSNNRLRLPETGDAIERRVRLMPFQADFRRSPDKDMPAKLLREAPAILRILIEYARRWFENGLPQSDTVLSASSEYLLDEDVVRQFITEKCVRGEKETVPRTELYEAFCRWSKTAKPPSARSFKDKMLSRGYECKRNGSKGGANYFFGLRLLMEGEEKPPEQEDLISQDPALNQVDPARHEDMKKIPPICKNSLYESNNRKVIENTPDFFISSCPANGGQTGQSDDDVWLNPWEQEDGGDG